MTRLIVFVWLFLAGCSERLTADAVVLIDSDDIDYASASVEQFAPHIGVTVTVTDDAGVYYSWPTEERWQVHNQPVGTDIKGKQLCKRNDGDDFRLLAVTDYNDHRIHIGDCLKGAKKRPFAIAHEIGHMVGAGHCATGIMKDVTPTSLEPSSITIAELRVLYDLN